MKENGTNETSLTENEAPDGVLIDLYFGSIGTILLCTRYIIHVAKGL